MVTGCGDGVLDLGEQCDDGNDEDDDGCTRDCRLPVCGDGVVQGSEACDDGAGNGDDRACTEGCRFNVCGDGKLHLGVEACDAGAANDDEGACTTSCQVAACGDGLVWLGVEACDDGNLASGDGCRADCRKVEACGDGELDVGEACDDGAAGLANPADGCDLCAQTSWHAQALAGAPQVGSSVNLSAPGSVATDLYGNVYIADTNNHRVRKLDVGTGAVTQVAGSGTAGYAGDGAAASGAQLNAPSGVAVDGEGNVYVADSSNHCVRKVAASSGVITTVAGTGVAGVSGDGGTAALAQLRAPEAVAVDVAGNLYIADLGNNRVRRLAAGTGKIATIAGTGVSAYSGDGGPAASAQLIGPRGVAVDANGNVYIVDSVFLGSPSRIRKISAGSGVISTVAGGGAASGDGVPATSAALNYPQGVAVDAVGNLVVAETLGQRIRLVSADTGLITTIAGTGAAGFAGDGGPAVAALLGYPESVAVDVVGNIHVADSGNGRVRAVAAATGVISTEVGGSAASPGDGQAATTVSLRGTSSVAVDDVGSIYVAEANPGLDGQPAVSRIRKIAADTGLISTVAGIGAPGGAGDGGPAVSAQLGTALDLAVDGTGNVYIADTSNHRVRLVTASTGVITTIAGTGSAGFAGDGGPATSAQLNSARGVAVDGGGNVYVADTSNHRIRKIEAGTGVITTFAGTGSSGFSGDGGPAPTAQLSFPDRLVVDGAGNVHFADRGNGRVRRVAAGTGVITTTGAIPGAFGVALDATSGVAFTIQSPGSFVVALDLDSGAVSTVAGSGVCCPSDGGAAISSTISATDVEVTSAGDLLIAEATGGFGRVRKVDRSTGLITTVVGAIDPEGVGPLEQARLADPRGLALAPTMTLFAGGGTGTVEALWTDAQRLDAVVGRYPQMHPTGSLARYRDSTFGVVGGVAYDAAAGRFYLSETTRHRLWVVTPVDPFDARAWTISALAGDAVAGLAGFADGPASMARFDSPAGLYLDEATRTLYVADAGNHVIRAMPVDLGGTAGAVTTVAGTPTARGIFGDGGPATAALLNEPQALTRCATDDLYIADTANHRVRRVEAATGVITTVLGDGVAASSGQGTPAWTFPVDAPRSLACDAFGNVYVTSRTTVRELVADAAGVVDGWGAVQTIYGAAPRTSFPETATSCLTGVAVVDGETVWATDACAGILVELWRQPVP
ncbi:MAG: hypothetical protein R2939_19455 [Kofleriaceae bacterium]